MSSTNTARKLEHLLRHRILVLESRQDQVEILSFVLRRHSYEMIPTSNAKEALEQLERGNADLLIVDSAIIGMSTYEFFSNVQKNHPQVPVLVLTNSDAEKAPIEEILGSSHRIVPKPFSPTNLIKTIQDLTKEET